MAVVNVSPYVLVGGEVQSVNPVARKADGQLLFHVVLLRQQHGGQIEVQVWDNKDRPDLPEVGEFWAADCGMQESPDFGASLRWAGHPQNAIHGFAQQLELA
ncbi:hypothetical protein [Nesterenkonia populi]|uniref:hypothetical protein n=1 Tax=Nesterenkonia populi TaxID=1591087 RepID=UPI0011BF2029|nr:hypothetical protein [Nesterenkonia populi]